LGGRSIIIAAGTVANAANKAFLARLSGRVEPRPGFEPGSSVGGAPSPAALVGFNLQFRRVRAWPALYPAELPGLPAEE